MVMEPEPMDSVNVPLCFVKRILTRFGRDFWRILGRMMPASGGMTLGSRGAQFQPEGHGALRGRLAALRRSLSVGRPGAGGGGAGRRRPPGMVCPSIVGAGSVRGGFP